MKQLAFKSIPEFAIAEGATEPNLGIDSKGAWAWSTVLARPVYWTGSSWTAGISSPDPLDLSASDPISPASGTVRLFGRDVSGRTMPAFKSSSGLNSSIQPFFARNEMAIVTPQGNGVPVSAVGTSVTAIGTATAANVGTTNLHSAMKRINYLAATAAPGAVAGFRCTFAQYFRGVAGTKMGGFHYVCRYGPATGSAINATRRGFCGLTSSTITATDADPTTLPNILGVGFNSTDTNQFIMYRTGTGAVAKIDTGMPKAAGDADTVYELAMFCAPGSSELHFEFTNLVTDATFKHTATSSLPAATTLLTTLSYYSVGGVSSVVGLALMGLYIETDY